MCIVVNTVPHYFIKQTDILFHSHYEFLLFKFRCDRVGLVSLEQSRVIFNSDIMLFQTLPDPPSTSSRASLRDFQANSPMAIKRATEEPRIRTTKIPPTLAKPSSAALVLDLLPSSWIVKNKSFSIFVCKIAICIFLTKLTLQAPPPRISCHHFLFKMIKRLVSCIFRTA